MIGKPERSWRGRPRQMLTILALMVLVLLPTLRQVRFSTC